MPLPLVGPRERFTRSGDVGPANPSTWIDSTTGYIGQSAAGALTVNGGSGLLSYDGYIGFGSGSAGTVTVDGNGSTWTNGGNDIFVGDFGGGTLRIVNGVRRQQYLRLDRR